MATQLPATALQPGMRIHHTGAVLTVRSVTYYPPGCTATYVHSNGHALPVVPHAYVVAQCSTARGKCSAVVLPATWHLTLA